MTRFRTMVLDPPWPYERTSGQGVLRDYAPMTWDDLRAIGPLLHAVAAPNCAIFLWTCPPLLVETVDTVRAWGFRYITKGFCWVKTVRNGAIWYGVGSYTASNTEDVWLLSNGAPERQARNVSQVVPTTDGVLAPRGKHSQKPEAIQDRIERLCAGPYLEVFARRRRPGWTCVGNELDGLDIRESLARVAAGADLPVVATAAYQGSLFDDSQEAA